MSNQIQSLIQTINSIREQLDEMERTINDNIIKLPWHLAPPWASWAIMQPHGQWYWTECEPELYNDQWDASTMRSWESFTYPTTFNWKMSKRQRP